MNISSLSSVYTNFIQPLLGGTSAASSAQGSSSVSSASGLPADSKKLSPFAQLVTTLQDLQQQSPTQYQNVTSQIATNLQAAAQKAQSGGNTALASQLTQLATDFKNSSQNNQLPDFQDLASAISQGHHRHGHSDSSTSAAGSSSSNSATQLSQFTTGQNQSLEPAAIIMNTLSSAGISLST